MGGSAGSSTAGQGGSGLAGTTGVGGSGQAGNSGVGGQGGQGGSSTGGSGGSAQGGSGGSMPFPPGNVKWITWTSQQTRSGANWGSALTDIANHLPSQYGTTYDDTDLVTFGHETSHGIHAHLRNYENNTGKRANAFYVLHDKAALVVEPNIRKSDAVPYVPASLQNFRYGTYVTGSASWDDTPLYIWDEWNAYVNGAEVGVNRVKEGVWKESSRDQTGNVEFIVYAVAVAMAVKAKDSAYWQAETQFREFLKWNIERGMKLHAEMVKMPEMRPGDDQLTKIRTASDAANWRQFLVDTYGASWTQSTLGF